MTPPAQPLTFSAVENMKRAAKKLRKADGIPHYAALEQVARAHGFATWHAVTLAAAAPVDVAVRGAGWTVGVIRTTAAGAGTLAELMRSLDPRGSAD